MLSIEVIIPAFNASAVIVPTLQAVLRQRLPADASLAVTVVDDGSTDDTAAAVRAAFGNAVKVIVLPENCGRGNAINAGVRASTAAYVVILDADCIPMGDGTLLRFADYFREGAIVVAGQATSTATDFWGRYIREANARRAQLGGVLQMTTPFCGIRRDLFMAAGGFLPEYRHYGFEDRDLLLRLQARAGSDEGFVVAADITASHEDRMSGRAVLRKMQEAGRHTAPVFLREHPAAYARTAFAGMDWETAPIVQRTVLWLLQPLLYLLQPVLDGLLATRWMPYAVKRLLLRAGSALAYFRGSCQR